MAGGAFQQHEQRPQQGGRTNAHGLGISGFAEETGHAAQVGVVGVQLEHRRNDVLYPHRFRLSLSVGSVRRYVMIGSPLRDS